MHCCVKDLYVYGTMLCVQLGRVICVYNIVNMTRIATLNENQELQLRCMVASGNRLFVGSGSSGSVDKYLYVYNLETLTAQAPIPDAIVSILLCGNRLYSASSKEIVVTIL